MHFVQRESCRCSETCERQNLQEGSEASECFILLPTLKCLCESQVEVAMVKDPQVWRETEDWLKMVKMHSERFRTKLSIQVMYE